MMYKFVSMLYFGPIIHCYLATECHVCHMWIFKKSATSFFGNLSHCHCKQFLSFLYWHMLHGNMQRLIFQLFYEKQFFLMLCIVKYLNCTFHGGDEIGTVSRGIPTCFHAVSSTRLVVPFTVTIIVIVITENSYEAQKWFS